MEKTYTTFDYLDVKKLHFKSYPDYVMIFEDDIFLGIIGELRNAGDLKNYKHILTQCPLIIMDEFIVLENDYIEEEYEKLKIIYETVEKMTIDIVTTPKNISQYLLFKPKIFYLGNPMNFLSEFFSGLDMFDILENHEINTIQKYGNIVLRMKRNDEVNKYRDISALNSFDSYDRSGEFITNKFNLADTNIKKMLIENGKEFKISLDDGKALSVNYVFKSDTIYKTFIMLKVEQLYASKTYLFNFLLKDKKSDTYVLEDKYFKDNHYKKYIKGGILFSDNFSKNYITENERYTSINILKCIKKYESLLKNNTNKKIIVENNDELKHQATLMRLNNKYFGG